MKRGRMQAKDVPTLPILRALRASIVRPGDSDPMTRARWRTHWQGMENPGEDGQPWSLPMPEGVPDNVALAKMRQLAHKGLVDGCGCGCRGDWVITDKGLARLVEMETPRPEDRPVCSCSFNPGEVRIVFDVAPHGLCGRCRLPLR